MKNFTTKDTKSTKEHENIDIFFKNECYEIYGCIFAVYKKLGTGSDYKLGLLVNFNNYPKVEIVRLVR